MKIDDLPEDMQKGILMLKNNSATIEADVLQALDEAGDLKQFQECVKTAMDELRGEIDSALQLFCQHNCKGIVETPNSARFISLKFVKE